MLDLNEKAVIIPLRQVPSQEFQVLLGGQPCILKIYEKAGNVYCDLTNDDEVVWLGILCLTDIGIKPAGHLNFKGDLFFRDLNGHANPHFSGFMQRWFLEYAA